MGRYLEQEDEREGAPSVVVIGENVWRNRFAEDPSILDEPSNWSRSAFHHRRDAEGLRLPGQRSLLGTAARGPGAARATDGAGPYGVRAARAGATLASAQAELAVIGQRTALAFPKIYARLRPQVMPYARPFAGHSHNSRRDRHPRDARYSCLCWCLSV